MCDTEDGSHDATNRTDRPLKRAWGLGENDDGDGVGVGL